MEIHNINFFNWMSLSIISLIIISCIPNRKVITKTVSHSYYNISFEPEKSIERKIENLKIAIEPVDAAKFNALSFETAQLNGNYEREKAILTSVRYKETDNLSKFKKSFIKGKENAISLIKELLEKNLIPSNTAHQLGNKIYEGSDYGLDGTEITSLSGVKMVSSDYNPYRVGQNYLSVFKIKIKNEGNIIDTFSLKRIQIINGSNLLIPLDLNYFEKYLSNQSEKIKNVYRFNMPEQLIVSPNREIEKYIAIPAINTKKRYLQVQILNNREAINFDFIIKEESIRNEYSVESYFIIPSGIQSSAVEYYFAVCFSDGLTYALIEDTFYVDGKRKNENLTIFGVAIDKLTSKAYVAKKQNTKVLYQEDHKIKLSFTNDKDLVSLVNSK